MPRMDKKDNVYEISRGLVLKARPKDSEGKGKRGSADESLSGELPCPTKMGLTLAYRDALIEYSRAVGELVHSVGVNIGDDHERLGRIIKTAGRSSAHALEALEAHTMDHGC